jgi:hypothetical protein
VFVLLLMSLGFGLVTQLLFRRRIDDLQWVGVTALMFAIGVFVSEVLFGWATGEDLQPNIDGLSFDEVLVTFLVGLLVVVGVRLIVWQRTHRQGT